MMKSIIICEGKTDATLLGYYLSKVDGWIRVKHTEIKKDTRMDKLNLNYRTQEIGWYKQNNNSILCIAAAGGSSRIVEMLDQVIEINKMGSTERYSNMAVISDRDDENSEAKILESLKNCFENNNIMFDSITNNTWNRSYDYMDEFKTEVQGIEILPLILPLDEEGAIETFMIRALARKSELEDVEKIDKKIIDETEKFIVSMVDISQGKYLSQRRRVTKAKFETVFVIMTAAESFKDRDDILKGIPWENYEYIQESFTKLHKLSRI